MPASAPLGLPYSASIEEASRLSGLSRTKIYDLLVTGKLRGKKNGRRTLVLMDGVRAYVDGLPAARFGAGGVVAETPQRD